MTPPPWRIEEFLTEFRRWRETFDPSSVWRGLVCDRVVDMEAGGLTDSAVFLGPRTDGFEAIEPIHGTTVSILCLVYEREGRNVVVDIRS